MLKGTGQHEDFCGHKGALNSGDVQVIYNFVSQELWSYYDGQFWDNCINLSPLSLVCNMSCGCLDCMVARITSTNTRAHHTCKK